MEVPFLSAVMFLHACRLASIRAMAPRARYCGGPPLVTLR